MITVGEILSSCNNIINSATRIDGIFAIAADKIVITLAAINCIVACQAGYTVGATITNQNVGSVIADDGVICRATNYHLKVIDSIITPSLSHGGLKGDSFAWLGLRIKWNIKITAQSSANVDISRGIYRFDRDLALGCINFTISIEIKIESIT